MSKKSHRHPPQAARPPVKQQTVAVQITGAQLAQSLGLNDMRPSIDALEKHRGSRGLCIVYGVSQLAPAMIPQLEHLLMRMGHVPKLDVFLRSTGGIAEVPWRVVSLLREFTDELGVIISKCALSGGCHIALAGDELVMTPFTTLGSVDPTRNHALLPKDDKGNPIPVSVQDLKHCIEFIRDQLGESYQSQNLALIVSELFRYINPLSLGALEQAYNLARLITRKVLKTRKKPLEEDHIKKIVDVLSGQYYSHSFLISRAEVESDLNLPVTKPDAALSTLIANLDSLYDADFQKKATPPPPNREPVIKVGGFMQTTQEGFMISQLWNQAEDELKTDPWVKFYE